MIPNKMSDKDERLTSQKKFIREFLEENEGHPCAKEIYKAAKKKLPRISKATVYRILNDLKDKGEIQEISIDVTRFETDTSSHAHFICTECGKIYDHLNLVGDFEELLKNHEKDIPGKFGRYHIYIYGICNNCN